MLRLSNSILLVVLIAGLLSLALMGQDPVYHADTRLVPLYTTVVDRDGKLVTNLPQNAFEVFENNVPQTVRIFRREDVPVSVGLVVDNSGSMVDKRQKVEAAALQWVKSSNPQDEVFIVNFNDQAYRDSPFTNKIAVLEEALTRIDARGGTAMREAISLSLDYMKENAKLDKKLLLVVTDGDDNMSDITLEQLVQKAQDSEVLIYIVGLLSEEDRSVARKAKRALDTIAEASGGSSYYPIELGEVDQLALRMAHEVRNQYTIAYTPSNEALDGSYRQIRVTVKGPNRPVARTRTGYYAKPSK